MIRSGTATPAKVNSAARTRHIRKLRTMLRRVSAVFFWPMYWEIMIPATAPTAETTTL